MGGGVEAQDRQTPMGEPDAVFNEKAARVRPAAPDSQRRPHNGAWIGRIFDGKLNRT